MCWVFLAFVGVLLLLGFLLVVVLVLVFLSVTEAF